MKRLFLILLITTATAAVSIAQPRAIGIRIGGNQELSFQQGIHYGKRFVQFDVGSFYAKGLQITWTYNWLSQAVAIMIPSATSRISSKFSIPCWFSILANNFTCPLPVSSQIARTSLTSFAVRTNEIAIKLIPWLLAVFFSQ